MSHLVASLLILTVVQPKPSRPAIYRCWFLCTSMTAKQQQSLRLFVSFSLFGAQMLHWLHAQHLVMTPQQPKASADDSVLVFC